MTTEFVDQILETIPEKLHPERQADYPLKEDNETTKLLRTNNPRGIVPEETGE